MAVARLSCKNGKRERFQQRGDSVDSDVIHEWPLSRQIAAGGDPGEIAEFVSEIRLIVNQRASTKDASGGPGR